MQVLKCSITMKNANRVSSEFRKQPDDDSDLFDIKNHHSDVLPIERHKNVSSYSLSEDVALHLEPHQSQGCKAVFPCTADAPPCHARQGSQSAITIIISMLGPQDLTESTRSAEFVLLVYWF